ncbi:MULTISPECIES: glycosyltransferase [unclassified Tatumella]|uniref:glycosyltransferase n=1 Tax=unclassified Tatumella TaxID=2649542 RepID=UPI001BAF67E5|nr:MULTISPECIES: glycosyltransferase [unclassified Tatumella]MBS0857086.1 glycosyltransferase [Tatumella sp. JGM16]MBS0913803.1 glycosyltransferase [Tatumella sp. JGM91]
MKKKILIACRAYYPDVGGGGELSTKTLAENLLKKGYDVSVLAISDKSTVETIEHVPVTRIKNKNIYWSLDKKNKGIVRKILWHVIDSHNVFIENKLRDKLEEISPDILITSTIEDVSSVIWKLASRKKIRVMHVLRSYSLLCSNANMFKSENCEGQCKECKMLTLPKKINSKYVDDIIGISDYILKKHLDLGYFKNSKSTVIYNICLDDSIAERKIISDEVKVGYLGRIHKTKGIEIIFSAMSQLSDNVKRRCSVYVAGSGDPYYMEELRKVAKENNVTTVFTGNVNATEFLDKIDLLVVPSIWNEPFGRVVVEGMGRGVAVLGKRSGGIPELLEKNPKFIFDTAEDLSAKISDFVNETISFDFDLSDFSTNKIINDWECLINNNPLPEVNE